jgi:hypothetical protein
MGVECDPLVLRRDFAGGEVEAVDIGCPAGAIDDAIGLDRPL